MTRYVGRSKARLDRAKQRLRSGWGQSQIAVAPASAPSRSRAAAPLPPPPPPAPELEFAFDPGPAEALVPKAEVVTPAQERQAAPELQPPPGPEFEAGPPPLAPLPPPPGPAWDRRALLRGALGAGTLGLATLALPRRLSEAVLTSGETAVPPPFERALDFTARPEIAPLRGVTEPKPAAPAVQPVKGATLATRRLLLHNENTGETIKATYWADGDYVLEELEQIHRLLRDHHAEEMHAIDIKLVNLLYDMSRKLETEEPFHILSAYRTPRTNAKLAERFDGVATNSFHLKGRAVDLDMPGRRKSELLRAALSLRAGGVGNYRTYLHLDTGPVRRW